MSVFRGGLPYGPEIQLLEEAFPVKDLTEGRIIKHEDLEEVLQQGRRTARYRGVICSWMGRKRDQNSINIKWESCVGIVVLDPAAMLNFAETRTHQKIRQTGRAIRMFGLVDRSRLDETGQKRFDHQTRVAALLKDSVERARKEMAVELSPVQSIPKIAAKK